MSICVGARPLKATTAAKETATARDLGSLSKDELQAEARRLGLEFGSRATKDQLVALIEGAAG